MPERKPDLSALSDDELTQRILDLNFEFNMRASAGWPKGRVPAKGISGLSNGELRGLRKAAKAEADRRGIIIGSVLPSIRQSANQSANQSFERMRAFADQQVTAKRELAIQIPNPKAEAEESKVQPGPHQQATPSKTGNHRAANVPEATARSADGRELKIWEVIQRGTKGRQYCRELDNANIAPLRKGVWEDGPRKYLAAYNLGKPWRHRIEDEKDKIRRKALKLASERASE